MNLYKTMLIVILSFAISTPLSYALSDRGDNDSYLKQSRYSPSWVINSIYSPNVEAKAKHTIDKLNQAENNHASINKQEKSKDTPPEANIPLKKKRSAAEAKKSIYTIQKSGDETDPNVVGGFYIPNIDSEFLSPERIREMFNVQVANSPLANGARLNINVPDSSNVMTLWQSEDRVMYEIKDGSGNLLVSDQKVEPDLDDLEYRYTCLSEIWTIGDKVIFNISGFEYFNDSGNYYGSRSVNIVQFDPRNGVYEKGRYAIRVFDLSQYNLTGAAAGTYYWHNLEDYRPINVGGVTDPFNFWTIYETPRHGNITPRPYTPAPPTVTTITTFSLTPASCRPYSRYGEDYLSDAYYRHNTSNSRTINDNISASIGDSKKESLSACEDINLKLNSNIVNLDAINISNKQIDLSLTDHLSLDLASSQLEDMIILLEAKDNKNDLEENLLSAVSAISQNIQYLDASTIKDFNEAMHLVRAFEEMKNLLNANDFNVVSKTLANLVEAERNIYSQFLSSSNDVYDAIAKLLDIRLEDRISPDSSQPLSSAAKKKIAVDLAVEKLKSLDESALTQNQKKALALEKEILAPLRDEYIGKLRASISSFVWDIRDIMKNKAPVSILKDESGLKTMFLLQDEPRHSSP